MKLFPREFIFTWSSETLFQTKFRSYDKNLFQYVQKKKTAVTI
jgi:hypothetical protein